jgi:hypothetical protein
MLIKVAAKEKVCSVIYQFYSQVLRNSYEILLYNSGAFAVYLEPWHADIFDFLDLRKNHGKVMSLPLVNYFWYENNKLSVFYNNCDIKLTLYRLTAF